MEGAMRPAEAGGSASSTGAAVVEETETVIGVGYGIEAMRFSLRVVDPHGWVLSLRSGDSLQFWPMLCCRI
ncbi:phosphatidylinositol-4-phosphate 5-kinase, type I, gamma b isoform X1 [Tachysurus ichikawai]